MGKILTLIYRLRETFKSKLLQIEHKEPEIEKPKEEIEEEPKVVELDETNEEHQSTNIKVLQNGSDEPDSKPIEKADEAPIEVDTLQKSIRVFLKLILTEGIENSKDLDNPFGFGDEMSELGPLLQSLVA